MPKHFWMIFLVAGFSLSQNPLPAKHKVLPGHLYRLTITAPQLRAAADKLPVQIRVGNRAIAAKELDVYDPELTLYWRADSPAAPTANQPLRIEEVHDADAIESSWEAARPVDIEIDREYRALDGRQHSFDGKPQEGLHWYRLRNPLPQPRIVYLSVEVPDRALPSDIETFANGQPYSAGQHSYLPEATQTWPGWSSFRTRRIEAGQSLLLRVAANHPAYTLRVQSYPLERRPAEAVEMGMDFLVSLGDAWHANPPRRGAVAHRAILPHPEMSGCVACHPTVFTTRAYRTARQHGYADVHSSAFRRLEQRLVDNPRPLPGLPHVKWSRTIFSARSVSARLLGAGADSYSYLQLAGPARPEEEADGASPNVSPAEIAYSALERGESRSLFETFQPKNVLDLNWLILGRKKLGLSVHQHVEQLWKWQRADGLWPLDFDAQQEGAEFITWHALYALAEAGERGARIDRLAAICLSRQQPSGEWNGPARHKSFATPFRDTQFAVMALSTLYPGPVSTRPADPPLRPRDISLSSAVTASQSPNPLTRLRAAQELVTAYWRAPGPAALSAILHRLLQEEEERVRFVYQQALYNVLDENEGYLATWAAALQNPEAAASIEAGLAARRRESQQLVAHALEQASRQARLTILNSLWDHPQRHAGLPRDLENRSEVVLPAFHAQYQAGLPQLHEPGFVYEAWEENRHFRYDARNPFYKTRVGNDSDLPDWGAVEPTLEKALGAALRGDDDEIALSALKALSLFPQGTSPELSLAAIELLETNLAPAVAYVFDRGARGKLQLDHPYAFVEAKLTPALLRVLDASHPVAIRVIAHALSELTPGVPITRDPALQGRWEKLLLAAANPEEKAQRLAAAAVFPHIADGPLIRSLMLEALNSGQRALEVAAVDIFVKSYVAEPTNPVLAKQFVAASQGNTRRRMVDALDPLRFSLNLSALNRYNPGRDVSIPEDANLFSSDVSQFLLDEALRPDSPRNDDSVRRAARELVNSYPELSAWKAKLPPANPQQPDYEYFKAKVQPLLAEPAESDGRACVLCHATQAGFVLRLPSKGGFTEAQTQANYRSALRRVNLQSPKQSLLLIKPTRPNDNAGDPALAQSTHGGGTRWGRNTEESSASLAYETILDWIRGAKLSRD